MQDDVQIRIQIRHFQISSSAKVSIALMERDGTIFDPDDEERLVHSYPTGGTVPGGHPDPGDFRRGARQFPLLEVEYIGTNPRPPGSTTHVTRRDMRQKILFEKRGANTYLLTELNLYTDFGSGAETDQLEYYCVVTVTDGSLSLTSRSPVIKAIRWWATPSDNLEMKKTHATAIVPLVDGEAFFAELLSLLNGAADHIYFHGWSTWPDTPLDGGPLTTGTLFSAALLSAAGRGVKVYVMLDYFNGRSQKQLFDSWVSHANIVVKVSTHPETLLGTQMGTYHEKYCIVDGDKAVVGGIDVHPERYQPQTHAWRFNYTFFRAQGNARHARLGGAVFGREFMLWHDCGVKVEGPVVEYLERDYVRRWNVAAPSGNTVPLRMPRASRSYSNIQVVKSDQVSRSLGPGRGTELRTMRGTKDAYKQAILEARHYIYIENQYFSSTDLRSMLLTALEDNSALQLIVVIPFMTEEAIGRGGPEPTSYVWSEGAFDDAELTRRIQRHGEYLQAQMITELRAVSNAVNRVGVFGLAGCAGGMTSGAMIYPHSKTMIVDDTWAIIGSANTNGRGFAATDGEMNIVIHDRYAVTQYRRSLWREHLGVNYSTRRIRSFFMLWDYWALSGKNGPADCTCAELSTVHAVKFLTPPPGVEYDGPASTFLNAFGTSDDYS